jgi:hypothetical protein
MTVTPYSGMMHGNNSQLGEREDLHPLREVMLNQGKKWIAQY